MNCKNIEEKCLIYEHGLDKIFRRARKCHWQGYDEPLDDFKNCYGEDMARVCKNLDDARYHRAKRARKRIGCSVLSGNAFFLTLTFRDEVFTNTNEETRRRYVSRALRDIGEKYIANIDYGSKREREHYHAIVEPKSDRLASWNNGRRKYENVPDLREWINNYGFVTIEPIGSTEEDMRKVAKYTAKLGAHAVKESTLKGVNPPRLIYSRKRFTI